MSKQEIVKVFGERRIRSIWDDEIEEWYFSAIDVVAVLTDSVNPANYWKVLKNRLKKEGNKTVTNCNRLKLRAEDGKMRLTDVATAEQMFRIIQSIPSPKAEPFKVWMAKVAAERIDQLQDPVTHKRVAASGGNVAKERRTAAGWNEVGCQAAREDTRRTEKKSRAERMRERARGDLV